MHQFSPCQTHRLSCVAFMETLTLYVFEPAQLKRGQKVCESGSAVTLRHREGGFSGLTNAVQRPTRMSHISKI